MVLLPGPRRERKGVQDLLAAPERDLDSAGPSAGRGEGAARETGGRAGSAGAVAAPRDVC